MTAVEMGDDVGSKEICFHKEKDSTEGYKRRIGKTGGKVVPISG